MTNSEKEKKLNNISRSSFNLIFVITFISTIFISIEWIYRNENLTSTDKLFYFITLLVYLYFPLLIINVFGKSESSLDKLNNSYPIFVLILNLLISWTDFNSFSYFMISLVSISFTNFMAILYTRKYLTNKTKITYLTVGFILIEIFSLYMHIVQPFSNINRFRFIYKMLMFSIGIGGSFLIYILNKFKNRSRLKDGFKKVSNNVDKELKNLRIIIVVSILIIIVSIILPLAIPLVLRTRYPIIAMRTTSMEPVIQKGDLLFVIGVDPEDIKNGSIIAYNARGLTEDPGFLVIHRIVDIGEGPGGKINFIMKGDANEVNDPDPVDEDRVIGMVYGKLSQIGWIVIAIEDWNLEIPLLILFIAILIIPVAYLSIEYRDTRRQKGIKEENNGEKHEKS